MLGSWGSANFGLSARLRALIVCSSTSTWMRISRRRSTGMWSSSSPSLSLSTRQRRTLSTRQGHNNCKLATRAVAMFVIEHYVLVTLSCVFIFWFTFFFFINLGTPHNQLSSSPCHLTLRMNLILQKWNPLYSYILHFATSLQVHSTVRVACWKVSGLIVNRMSTHTHTHTWIVMLCGCALAGVTIGSRHSTWTYYYHT